MQDRQDSCIMEKNIVVSASSKTKSVMMQDFLHEVQSTLQIADTLVQQPLSFISSRD